MINFPGSIRVYDKWESDIRYPTVGWSDFEFFYPDCPVRESYRVVNYPFRESYSDTARTRDFVPTNPNYMD